MIYAIRFSEKIKFLSFQRNDLLQYESHNFLPTPHIGVGDLVQDNSKYMYIAVPTTFYTMPFWPRLRTFIDTSIFVLFLHYAQIFLPPIQFFLFETSAFADRFSGKCLEKNEAIHNFHLSININSIFTTLVCVTLKTHICVTGQNSGQCLKYMNSKITERQRISVYLFIHNIKKLTST